MEELFYQIALTRIDSIGHKLGRVLLSKFDSAKAVFEATENQLATIGGLGKGRLKSIKKAIDQKRIEKEIQFIEQHKIQPVFITDKHYPRLLKECPDAPILLYFKGQYPFNQSKNIAIVGTRTNTDYGRQTVEELITGLKEQKDITIISGLAFGIDTIAHKAALKNGLSTIGVLGHGLDRLYPYQNRQLAGEMLEQGGLLTEYMTETKADPQNFPQRNRIVAGMADVVVVAETGVKGGSMITAKLGCSYNREIAAFPGRTIDSHSQGCNYLIQTNIAHLISNATDLLELMNWQPENSACQAVQRKLFESLEPEEQKVVTCLENEKEIHIDELALKTGMDGHRISSLLLSLELDGLVRALPGKRFRLS